MNIMRYVLLRALVMLMIPLMSSSRYHGISAMVTLIYLLLLLMRNTNSPVALRLELTTSHILENAVTLKSCCCVAIVRTKWAVVIHGKIAGDAGHRPADDERTSSANNIHSYYDHHIDTTIPDHLLGDITLGDTPTLTDIARSNVTSHDKVPVDESYCATTYGTSYSRGTNDKLLVEREATE